MRLALLWCWKEWRAQRVLLGAYALLSFASLCCVLLLTGRLRTGVEGAQVLLWFVATGVVGVLVFAAPQLVCGEFCGKDDTFVRRLPGALRPAFGGKLLFLLLATLALPLLGLLIAGLLLVATGHTWEPEPVPRWSQVAWYGAWALMLLPWIWLVATWLPGGRMAVGGTALLALLLGLCGSAVTWSCEGLLSSLDWRPWAIAAVPVGLALTGISWVRGRRGGGHARSSRIGLLWLAAALLAPAGWLGMCMHEYHHPDLQHLEYLGVQGVSPDLRFAIGHATSNKHWNPVAVRIDLQSGAIEQIGGIHTTITHELLPPVVVPPQQPRRYWQLIDTVPGEPGERTVFDLCTGRRQPVEFDIASCRVVLPEALKGPVEADQRATWPFRAPGGIRVAVIGSEVLFEQRDGSVQREPLPGSQRLLVAAGHGMRGGSVNVSWLYDLTRRQVVSPPGIANQVAWAVRGIWMLREQGTAGHWRRFDPESGGSERCDEMEHGEVVGLFDDDRLLCTSTSQAKGTELFLYRPVDHVVTPLRLPEALRNRSWFPWGPPLEARSTVGRPMPRCLCLRGPRRDAIGCLVIDPVSLTVEARLAEAGEGEPSRLQLLTVTDDGNLLVSDRQQIVRVDPATQAHTVLFPRPR